MKKFASIFKNKEIVGRIFFTIMILFVIRIGAAITVPGVKTTSSFTDAMNSGNAIAMMNLLGGGALSNFSVFALGVSPYITSQIIVQLLSKDVLPALTELSKQGQYGRKKIEMATRYLTLLLGAVQAYGIIMMMQNSSYISLTLSTSGGGAFWTYLYIITVLLAGAMLTMWLGDQITEKGLGNGISIIIFAGCVRSLPIQISTAWEKWVAANLRIADSTAIIRGSFQFALYIVALLAIVTGVVFFEISRRKIPVQHAGKSGQSASTRHLRFLHPYGPNGHRLVHLRRCGAGAMAQDLLLFRDVHDALVQWRHLEDAMGLTDLFDPHHRLHLLLFGDADRSGIARGQFPKERFLHPGHPPRKGDRTLRTPCP